MLLGVPYLILLSFHFLKCAFYSSFFACDLSDFMIRSFIPYPSYSPKCAFACALSDFTVISFSQVYFLLKFFVCDLSDFMIRSFIPYPSHLPKCAFGCALSDFTDIFSMVFFGIPILILLTDFCCCPPNHPCWLVFSILLDIVAYLLFKLILLCALSYFTDRF